MQGSGEKYIFEAKQAIWHINTWGIILGGRTTVR